MKTRFIKDLDKEADETLIEIQAWISSKRKHKNLTFLDIVDSTGKVQVVINKNELQQNKYFELSRLKPDTAITLYGRKRKSGAGGIEVIVSDIQIVAENKKSIFPEPRCDFDIFNEKYSDHVLKNRHIYLRNPKLAAALKFKSNFIFEAHRYFSERDFVLIDAPVLTKLLLYDDASAFKLDYSDKISGKQEVFLSQCCTFQLESAVHVFEKVYNITPSFRAEHGKSNRHLREYWHLKAELAWVNLDDLITIAEDMMYMISKNTYEKSEKELKTLDTKVNLDKLKPPFDRITYDEASEIIRKEGKDFIWGKSLSIEDEQILTKYHGEKLLWVRGIPCSAEAFPFARDSQNPLITKTCDLIAPDGFGELMGTAEKITDKKELLERMAEKGKTTPEQLERYQWYIDLRDHGMVPHGGIGVGIERVIRYLLQTNHVRNVVSFPRLYGRIPNP